MIHDFTKCKNIYIICGRTVMRKGIDGLATLIQDSFELDPYEEQLAQANQKNKELLKQIETLS